MKPVTNWDDVPLVMDLAMAARIVGQSPEYLRKRAQKGNFPAYKEGRHWRVSKNLLMRHIDQRGISKEDK